MRNEAAHRVRDGHDSLAADLAAVRDLAIWLENRVIRFHMIEDRAYLQVEGDAFSEALQQVRQPQPRFRRVLTR